MTKWDYLFEGDPGPALRRLKASMGDINAWYQALKAVNRAGSELVVEIPGLAKERYWVTSVLEVSMDNNLLWLASSSGRHGMMDPNWWELNALLHHKIKLIND